MKPLEILLVEDNRADVVLIQEALELHATEFRLHVVTDGERAVDYLNKVGTSDETPCPDLLLLDMNLPKIEGPEVLKEFKKNPACLKTPVIVISSADSFRERQMLAALDVVHFFKKPSDFEEYMKLGQMVVKVVNAAEESERRESK